MDEDLEANPVINAFERFVVIEGNHIFDFINKTVLKGAQPVCQLSTQRTAVYSFPANGYAICVTEGTDLNATGQITELLKPWLEAAKETIAISVQPAYVYNTEKRFDRRCFVRGISAGSAKRLAYVEPLEDCNIVHGISAGGELRIAGSIES